MKKTVTLSLVGTSIVIGSALVWHVWSPRASQATEEPPRWAEVDDVVSGHKLELTSDEHLVYAGIRCPYPNEPLHKQARERNAELVTGKALRLRFDEDKQDRAGRLIAYVSVGQTMVNEALVREGLAYVRLTPHTRRFAKLLLDAQDYARQNRLGLWQYQTPSQAGGYPADPKYGNFHRPTCEEVPNINLERRRDYATKSEAFDAGMAPCSKCLP